MRARRSTAAVVALAVALLVTGCTTASPTARPANGDTATARSGTATGTDLTAALAGLPRASTQPKPARLAAGLVPPTNRWFSGLVFGGTAQPVFPLPLSVSPQPHGFAIGLPDVTATADTIAGAAVPAFGLRFGSDTMRVTRYDALSVTAAYGSDADVTLAAGWPYAAVAAKRDLTATFSAPVEPAGEPGVSTTTIGGLRYAVLAPTAPSGGSLHLARGQRAVLFALPPGVPAATMIAGARHPVVAGSAASSVGGRTASTSLRYRTVGNGPTVLAALPHQTAGGARCTAGSVASIQGPLALCRGTTLRFSVPRVRAADALDVAAIPASARPALRRQLAADLAATPAEPADTYTGGKWLYRLANLLQLARGLGDAAAATTARTRLDAALIEWTRPSGCTGAAIHCFVYDPRLKGVVGHEASFGSDQFNDHHFHYGYFLYAAAVAAADRPALLPRIRPVMDLLAADIGSPSATSAFPAQRTFDVYAGHSWASGTAPFADGNDEESSSEAVDAWNGLALWARVVHDPALTEEADWLLSTEAATAISDWVAPDLTPFPAFRHAFVSLQWGGKRDSATWFSADPAAKFAIQLIPMSPASGYLAAAGRARLARDLTEARSAHTGLFSDYLAMADVLAGGSPAAAAARIAALPASGIDGANSKAYAMAWVRSR